MKKICNLLLVMIMVFNMFVPCTIFAEEITEKIYRYDGYTIKYEIANSWTNNQNINITISNIGDEPIIGWALKYDAGGEISGLWNGTIYSCN